MSIRLTMNDIDDLCIRHCEKGEQLTEEEIDRLIDTAAEAITLRDELDSVQSRHQDNLAAQRAGG